MNFWVALALLVTGQECQQAQSLARAAYEERRYEEAAGSFARAVTACGPGAPLLLALGQAQLLARRPADALTTLDRIPGGDPDYVQALTSFEDPLYRRIAAELPEGTSVADFVTSITLTARKPDAARASRCC